MFWHAVLLLLAPLSSLVRHFLRDDRDREILGLRQQVLILQRALGRPRRLRRMERLVLLLSCGAMTNKQLPDNLMIVKPATLVGWHRQIRRRYWTFRQKRGPGRPRTNPEAQQLVLRIARENPSWGYTKIAGEVRKLGFDSLGRSTVERILKPHGLVPPPGHGGLSWHDFLTHYGHFIWACDLFTVTTATLGTYYVVFLIEIGTRRITFWNVSEQPDGAWVAQQFCNLSILHDDLPRHLLHDRASKFTGQADALLHSQGMKPIRLPLRSPNLNAHAERWIRTARGECLDRITVLTCIPEKAKSFGERCWVASSTTTTEKLRDALADQQ